MAFVAFLDTCVLFPTNLRDVILTIAEVGICQIRWSPDVLDELQRTYIKKRKWMLPMQKLVCAICSVP